MPNNKWIVSDYLEHMCEFLSIGLVPVINEPLSSPIEFKDWTFRFVFCDKNEEFEDIPVSVDFQTKTVVFNFQPHVYNIENSEPVRAVADYIIRGFYNGRDRDPVSFLFGTDTTLTDTIDMLCEHCEMFKNENIAVVDTVVSWKSSQLTDPTDKLTELMDACDILCDFIDFRV